MNTFVSNADSTLKKRRIAEDVSRLNDARIECAALGADAETSRRVVAELNGAAESLRAELRQRRGEYESAISALNERVAQHNRELATLYEQIHALTAPSLRMPNDNAFHTLLLAPETADARNDGADEQSRLSQVNELVAFLRRSHDAAIKVVDETNERLRHVSAELAAAKSEVVALQQSGNAAAMSDLSSPPPVADGAAVFERQLRRKSDRLAVVEAELSSANAELNALRLESTRRAAAEDELKAAAASAATECQVWRQRHERLMSKYDTVDAAVYNVAIAEIETLKSANAIAVEQLSATRADATRLSGELSAAMTRCDKLSTAAATWRKAKERADIAAAANLKFAESNFAQSEARAHRLIHIARAVAREYRKVTADNNTDARNSKRRHIEIEALTTDDDVSIGEQIGDESRDDVGGANDEMINGANDNNDDDDDALDDAAQIESLINEPSTTPDGS